MDHKRLVEVASTQLDRVLAFFPRADAKGSVVLAVDTGMLAVLASNCPRASSFDWYIAFALAPCFILGMSLWHLYRGAFPSLEGGEESLVYFREIAKHTELKFIEDFSRQTDEAYSKELLGQVWRNSTILREKFDHLSSAFNWMAFGIAPWLATLVLLVVHYPTTAMTVK